MNGRWFMYLAPDFLEKIILLDADDARDHKYLVEEFGAPETFLVGAVAGDFYDIEKGERILVRLGYHWKGR